LIETRLTPRGPYSLAFSARLASDATRTFRDGVFTAALGNGDIKAVSDQIDNLLAVQARVGAGMNRLDTASSRLAQIEESTTSMLSNTEDADMAEVITNYSTQQAVYQSALNSGARIVQTSLLDFLH